MSAEDFPDIYTGAPLEKLSGLEAVRRRPAMYLGFTDAMGILHMLYAVSDNSVEETLAGRTKHIDLVLHDDGSISVEDDGPGLPMNHAECGKCNDDYPTLDKLFTPTSNTNWKLLQKQFEGYVDPGSGVARVYPYTISVGIHGIALGVVSALSAWLEFDTRTRSGRYTMRFERGVAVNELKRIADPDPDGTTGTKIHWRPDPEIFKDAVVDPALVRFRLRELAHLNQGLRLSLKDCRTGDGPHDVFISPDGMEAFVMDLCFPERPMWPIITFHSATDGMEIEGALAYVLSMRTSVHCYANLVRTHSGKHESGFLNGITHALNKQRQLLGEDSSAPEIITRAHTRTGLIAALSVKVPRPLIETATRLRLGNPEVYQPVFNAVSSAMEASFEERPEIAKGLLRFCTHSWE